MAVLESALLFGLAPKHFIIPVGVERWVDVNEINASVRQPGQLLKAIPAVDSFGQDSARLLNHYCPILLSNSFNVQT
jgi:hypothetical protein